MKDSIPRVNWPAENGPYTVIQLYIEDEPHIHVGDCHDYHGIALKEFLDKHEIPYETRSDKWTSKEIPLESGSDYQAVGMGKANIWPKRKKALFQGESLSYGKRINRGHLDKIREIEPGWCIEANV